MRFSFRSLARLTTLLVALAPVTALAEGPARPLAKWIAPALQDRSGRIPFLVPIPPGTTAEALGLYEVAPGVAAARLDPEALALFGDTNPDLPLFAGPPKRLLLDQSVPSTGAPVFRAAAGGIDGSGAIVGIVDTGIDLTHPAFLDKNGKTRVAWLLTWGNPAGLHPEIEEA